ncbi:blpy protein [Anaeramoeba flamelloides]|uniref:Blpy protein n=1 Tax=Anaeramoeba flamelloides TaxID=1746091 RepID=A0AAV7ZEM8_9EUKA|nr:blpy protein [Anaeramoeba flamelloides]
MLSAKENLIQNKKEVVIHCTNLFFWFFSVIGIGTYSYDLAKYYSTLILALVLSFLFSIAILYLIAKNKYTVRFRKIVDHLVVILVILLLVGMQNAYNGGCFDQDKCQTKARVMAAGIIFQLIALFSLLALNASYSRVNPEYSEQKDDFKNDDYVYQVEEGLSESDKNEQSQLQSGSGSESESESDKSSIGSEN